MVQKKPTPTKTKKNAKLVRYPSYKAIKYVNKKHQDLYAQLITNKLTFPVCGKNRWKKSDEGIILSAIKNCRFEYKFNVPNLGVYRAELGNFVVSRDSEKNMSFTVEINVTRFVVVETGVTEFVSAPIYKSDWGHSIYDIVDSIVGLLSDAATDCAWEDYTDTPDELRGEEIGPEEYEKLKESN